MIEPTKTETACLPAGRYEFKDAGLYIGEWLNEKAVGLGLITKDKCQGEYTGLWDAGSEKSGVFLWPNAPGAMYEGEWAHNRRNGYGIFTREDWVIMGRFVDDFITVGVKCKENSIGRFEGEFENGLPSFGVETYADGGSYSGEYKNGVREGLGVRTSIPYGEIINFFPEEAAIAANLALESKKRSATTNSINHTNDTSRLSRRGSMLSQRSGEAAELEDPEMSLQNDDEPCCVRHNTNPVNPSSALRDLRMSCKFKCGFVLSSQRSELMLRRQQKLLGPTGGNYNSRRAKESGHRGGNRRSRSLTNLFSRSLSKESLKCIRRQGSVTERTARTIQKPETVESVFTLDQEDAIDPETIETFAGQWEADSRNGYGVCERSDGVIYEGQWLKNQRHGYGQTHFPDGACEQGRYQFGKLVFLSWPKGAKPHLLLYNYHIMREVSNSVKRARIIADEAHHKANEAREKLNIVENATERSKKAAELAREYSLETRELVKEMYPDFEQPGIKYMEDMVRLMRVTKRGNQVFESALQAAKDVIAGVEASLAEQAKQAEDGSPTETVDMGPPIGMSLDVPKSGGKPVSRAGSYRLKRQMNKQANETSQVIRSDDPNLTIRLPQIDRVEVNEYIPEPDEVKLEKATIHHPVTILIPQITTDNLVNDYDSPAIADSTKCNHVGSSEMVGPNPMGSLFLDVPNLTNFPMNEDCPMNMESYDFENNNFDDEQDGEISENKYRTNSRSSSVASTYVIMPTLSGIKPSSDIPTVPLAKLISNPIVMNDHFDQYTMNPSPLDGDARFRFLPTLTNSHSNRTIHPYATSVNNSKLMETDYWLEIEQKDEDTRTCRSQRMFDSSTPGDLVRIGGLVRRRTLPGFSTQPPVDLKNTRPKLTPVNENTLVVSTTSENPSNSMHHSPTLTPNSQLPPNSDQLNPIHTDSSPIYVVENGIRKRVYAHPQTQNNFPKLGTTQNSTTRPVNSTTMTGLINPQHVSNSPQSENSANWLKNQANKDGPLVVSNIMLEEPQDELLPLPTYFNESRVDLRHTVSRRSIPNLSPNQLSHLGSGLTQKELEQLFEAQQKKNQQSEARQRQGEIIIHFSDLLDWCYKNILLIIFVVVNCTLAYLFYLLIYAPIEN